MKQRFLFDFYRLLFLVIPIALAASFSYAGEIQWEALADRERLTIKKNTTEGASGSVGRVDAKGIIIPFTEVPNGLVVSAPSSAKLFNGTQQLGRSLAIYIQTPEFGFIVTKQSQDEIVIDLYPDPFGARWKPSGPPPLTDVAPNYAVSEQTAPLNDTKNIAAPSVSWGEAQSPEFLTSTDAMSNHAPVINTSGHVVVPVSNSTTSGQTPSLVKDALGTNSTQKILPTTVAQPLLSYEDSLLEASVNEMPHIGPVSDPATAPAQQLSSRPTGGTENATPVVVQISPSNADVIAPQVIMGAVNSTLPPPIASLAGLGIKIGPSTYKGRINTGDENLIPTISDADLLRWYPPAQDEPVSAHENISAMKIQASSSNATPIKNTTVPEVLYRDEKGNTIPPPLNPAAQLKLARDNVVKKDYQKAQSIVEALIAQGENTTASWPLPRDEWEMSSEQWEEALHIKAEMMFLLHKDTFEANFQDISDATRKAINYNPNSRFNDNALLRLGYMNLRMGDLPEAEASFDRLRRQFPESENVPLTYYHWGDYFLDKGDFQRASQEFQTIMSEYSSSSYIQEAALGFVRSNFKMGYYQQAFDTIRFIEDKWPWFYLDHPEFLNTLGDVAYRLNNFDYALQRYWLYINLVPEGKHVDIILTRIGDIYALQHQMAVATIVYKEAATRYGDKDGGLVAKMRLAEGGINDNPSIWEMYDAFEEPSPIYQPEKVYLSIINDYPQSDIVPMAKWKLATWYVQSHQYLLALDIASKFVEEYPTHPLVPNMKGLALKTFAMLVAESESEGNYSAMRFVWNRYPILQSQQEILTSESRIALGVSYWKDGYPAQALETINPFFLGNKVPKYSEMALNMALAIYLQHSQWQAIEEVSRRVSLWQLEPQAQQQMDYALALALENTEQQQKAAVIWNKLYTKAELPNDQMAYAAFFLARDAQDRKEYDSAYILGVDALQRFQLDAKENPGSSDTGKILSMLGMLKALTENGGRLKESLDYAHQYLQLLPEDDVESHASTLYQIARIKKEQGNEDGWRTDMQNIAQKYSNSIWGQKASADLRLATLDAEEKKFSLPGQ